MKSIKTFSLISLCVLALMTGCQPIIQTATPSVTLTATRQLPTHTVQPTATATVESTPAVAMQAVSGEVVRVVHPWGANPDGFVALMDEFNRSNAWGIRAEAAAISSSDALAEALEQGEMAANVWIGAGFDLLNPQNADTLLDLRVFIDDNSLGLAGIYQAGSPFEAFAPKVGSSEVQLALPLAYDAGLMFYNTQWAQALGFTSSPQGWDEFTAQMQAGLQANVNDDNYYNNGTGSLLLSKSVMSAQSWYAAFGGVYTIGNQGLLLDDEVLDASFRALKKSFTDDTSWAGLEPTPYQYFADRFALAYEGLLSDLDEQANYLPQGSEGSQWETIPYPSKERNGSIALESVRAGIISSEASSDLAAWLFVRWLLQPAQQALLADFSGLWPATGDPVGLAPAYAASHPAWASALNKSPILTLAPEAANWGINRFILQDAYLRIYGLQPEYFQAVLDVLRQTLVQP